MGVPTTTHNAKTLDLGPFLMSLVGEGLVPTEIPLEFAVGLFYGSGASHDGTDGTSCHV